MQGEVLKTSEEIRPTRALSPRETAWLSAWMAVAAAADCKEVKVATNWADKCLEAFDERFPERKP